MIASIDHWLVLLNVLLELKSPDAHMREKYELSKFCQLCGRIALL